MGAQPKSVSLPPKKTAKYDNRRRYRLVEPGLVRLDQRIAVRGHERGHDVTGRYWIFGLINVKSGSIHYLRGSGAVKPPGNTFGMFVPPFSLIEVKLERSDSSSRGLASARSLPSWCPRTPVVFRSSPAPFPQSFREMLAFLRRSSDFIEVGRATQPSALAARAKQILDRTYMEPMTLGGIAEELGVAHARMARVIRQDFGQTPHHYRTWLRVMDGMMQLIEGRAIVDVFQEIGFEDLGRFYKQFSRIANGTPGSYRKLYRSKNAKT